MVLLFHWFTLGALAMMLGYILFQYIFIRRKEYLFFSLYLFLTLLSFILIIEFYHPKGDAGFLLYHASYSTIPLLSFISFLFFIEHLLDIRKVFPLLNKTLRVLSLLLTIVLIADAVCYLWLDQISLHFLISNISRGLVLVVGLTGTIFLIRKVGKEGWFVLGGTLILVIAGTVTTLKNSTTVMINIQDDHLLETGMFYYRAGVIVQILFFAIGISYKFKETEKRKSELEIELLKEKFESEIEKQKAVEKTRDTIASDLHDDIGATLSSINIYSKLASDKIKKETGITEPLLEKIRETSQEMMNNMSDVIWSIQPEQDSMAQFGFRIKSLMQEYFDPSGVHYRLNNSIENETKLSMEQRKNLYLIIKEALNNIAKYSKADEVSVDIRSDKTTIYFQIRDNGIGMDINQKSTGNGVKNMHSRAHHLGGKLQFQSEPGKGTILSGNFPIENIDY